MGFCLSIIKTGKRKNTQKSKKARKILNELNRFDDHKISNDLFQLNILHGYICGVLSV